MTCPLLLDHSYSNNTEKCKIELFSNTSNYFLYENEVCFS